MVLSICLKRLNRKKQAKATETGVEDAEQQNVPSRSARYARAFRKRKQEDPEEWKAFLAKEAARARRRRANRTEEQKQKDREAALRRQHKFQKKQKAEIAADETGNQ